jgi:hypothetical protein
MSYESEILQKVTRQDLAVKGFRMFVYGLDGTTPVVLKVDADGQLIVGGVGQYVLSDKDDDASPNYYGYVDKDGNWYIMKETVSAGNDTYRFIKGSSDYTTNWTNRISLSYDYFYTIF